MDEKPVMLILDPVEINRGVLSQIFQQDYTVVEAASSQDGKKLIKSRPVNIALVDMSIMDIDGREVLDAIKKSGRYEQLLIIAMTECGDVEAEMRAIEMGAADFIERPFHPALVRCRVKNVMALQENAWQREEKAAKEEQLAEMHRSASMDALTGIYNRETFYREAAAMLKKNHEKKYCVIYFDISGFKAVNDLFHVDTGNLVLKTAAIYFGVLASEDGLCARVEADHFLLCLPADRADMDTIMDGLDNIVKPLSSNHNIVFYAGIYLADDRNLPFEQMCNRAQVALKSIKGSYVTRYAYYDNSLRDLMDEEQMIIRNMDFAMQDHQFCVYMQPVYRLHTDEMISAEALVRWVHPRYGEILPERFIPVFERNGFITRLDRFVWEEVCRFLKEQKDSGKHIIPISVNVSRMDFYNLDLLDFLLGLVQKYELEPWMLKLEITERAYTDNPHQICELVRSFRAKGFPVIMDNFGSGSSSLSMLKNLPLDALKIDVDFAHEAEQSERVGIVMESILLLVKKLGMNAVVEGVENKQQADYLAKMGCEMVQGYYYSHPLPEAEFSRLLEPCGAAEK